MRNLCALLITSALLLTLAGCGRTAEPEAALPAAKPVAAVEEAAPTAAPVQEAAPAPTAAPEPTPEPTQIVPADTEGILTMGHAFVLRVTVLPQGDTPLVWTSSDERVATVNADGLVTAAAPGSCTITVAAADGTAKADYALTVKAAPQPAVQAAAPAEAAAVPEPAAVQPEQPAETPAETTQTPDIVPGSVEDYDNRYRDFGTWSGIDWTRDSSCASADTAAEDFLD